MTIQELHLLEPESVVDVVTVPFGFSFLSCLVCR